MVSFSCETCNDTLKKPKLDSHAQRCRYAVFTCLDCNVTFQGTAYRAHTSCISEDQKYQKTVYKAPKAKPGKPQVAAPVISTPAPNAPPPATAVHPDRQQAVEPAQKRAREELAAVEVKEAAAVVAAEEPKAKKAKKEKTEKKAKVVEEVVVPKATLPAFLGELLPTLLTTSRPLVELLEVVVKGAKAEGSWGEDEVRTAVLKGISVGGEKKKKMLVCSFEEAL